MSPNLRFDAWILRASPTPILIDGEAFETFLYDSESLFSLVAAALRLQALAKREGIPLSALEWSIHWGSVVVGP